MPSARGWMLAVAALVFATPARGLDLPIRDPIREAVTAPSYRADILELRLTRDASRLAAIAVSSARLGVGPRHGSRPVLARLGVTSVDAAARSLGGATFVQEFRGERPPPLGSAAPDLSAYFLMRLPAGADLEAALNLFASLADVGAVAPVAILPVSAIPNDSLWSAATWFYQPNRRDIHAPEAWDVTTGDSDVVVAVLDTGVLPYHPDLGGTLAGSPGQIWTNVAERDGVAGVDDDGNGYEDDVHGWDFVNLGSGSGISPGEDWQDEDNDPNDYAGHGTAVAGLVGALTDNGIGVAGTAWHVRIMPLRMAWSTVANPLGLVDMSFAAQAVLYAWRNGARVINASWASRLTNGLDAVARAAMDEGVTIVSAAGNNSQPHELADFANVVAVAATDATDALAPFSNRGAFVDLSAPGVAMVSTFIAHPDVDSIGVRQPTYDDALDGTSFAAPLVSGAAALVHAQRRALGRPPITAAGMELRLRETAEDIAGQNPGGGQGTGRLRLDRALLDPPRSQAIRMTPMLGAPVAFRTSVGRTRIVTAHTNQMVMLEGQDGDTIWVAATPGTPSGQVAAGDMGGALGVGFFAATANGSVVGLDASGRALPGWPVTISGFGTQADVALGDLDGDGVPEVVVTSADRISAWHADGSPVSGFPVLLDIPVRHVALADLDGQPGVEIAVVAGALLYVIDGQGGTVPGWPVAVMAGQPPVVTRLGSSVAPTIVLASGTELRFYAPDGTLRFPARPLGAAATTPLALGDFDGDGSNEILVATNAPALAVFDSLGQALAAQNWPLALTAPAVGFPLIGSLDGSTRASVLAFRAGALYAYNDSARALPGFPNLGGAGLMPTLGEIDDDGHTEVLAGTDARGLFYIYDAGDGTWGGGPAAWPTAYGNFARTGSAIGVPAAPVLPDAVPSTIADLALVAASDTAVTLEWTATGEDGTYGRPQRYEVRGDTAPLGEAAFDAAPLRADVAATVDAGGRESVTLSGVPRGHTYWFAVKAVDRVDQRSAISNLAVVAIGPGAPLAGRAGLAIVSQAQPSRLPVALFWQGPGAGPAGSQRIVIYDIQGRRLRELPLAAADLTGVAYWDGRDDGGNAVGAGIYFARLLSGSFHTQARVVLLP